MEPARQSPIVTFTAAASLVAAALLVASVVSQTQLAPTACPEDAMLCPDGSAVGREGADCRFSECPTPAATSSDVTPAPAPRPLPPPPDGELRVCTADARLCPDGSGVGRDGERDCAWNPCPGEGTARGVAHVGPTCPAMRENDPSCADRPFSGALLLTSSGESATQVSANARGEWFATLAPGTYSVRAAGTAALPRCSGSFSVRAGTETVADVSCDSGIR